MYTFQYISDIHTEFYDSMSLPKIRAEADYLILAGDIGNPNTASSQYTTFLNHCSNLFKKVFLILGNHEAYNSTISDTKDLIKKVIPSNVIFLDMDRYDIDDRVTILGCTLWSNIKQEKKEVIQASLADFHTIHNWTIKVNNKNHTLERNWLMNKINYIRTNEGNKSIIVVTHHAPILNGTSHPMFDNSPLTSAFATDLSNKVLDIWSYPLQ
jgi:predicted phosphohydrolase